MPTHNSEAEALACPICLDQEHRQGAHAYHADPRCGRCREAERVRSVMGGRMQGELETGMRAAVETVIADTLAEMLATVMAVASRARAEGDMTREEADAWTTGYRTACERM